MARYDGLPEVPVTDSEGKIVGEKPVTDSDGKIIGEVVLTTKEAEKDAPKNETRNSARKE